MSLIAKYNFDSTDNGSLTIVDQSSNGYNLTKIVTNSEGSNAGWKDNSAESNPFNDSNIYSYRFERPDLTNNDRGGYFFTTTNISPNPYTGDFSLSFWCKPDTNTMIKHE